MNRILLAIACIVVSLAHLACRSGSDTPPSPEEPTAITVDDTAPPNVNSVLFEQEDKITDRRAVASKYETLEGQRVLRLKTDLVTISVNVQDVIEYFEKRFVELPHLTDEKALADKLRSEQEARSEYRYEDFLPGERDRVFFCVASLLEEGNFLMTLNDTGARVPRIFACKYSQIRGPMDGYAGRLFLLDDESEFLRTMDLIY